MLTDPIERDVLIEAPSEVVWRVVTEAEQIGHWFCDRVELDLRPGGSGSLTWEEHGMTIPIVVEAVEPPRAFAFRWVHPDGEAPRDGNSMRVEFTLTAEGESTRLRVVESGLDTIAWDDAEKARYRASHERGWDEHVADLREYAASAATAP